MIFRVALACTVGLLLSAIGSASYAADSGDQKTYDECMATARQDPERGFELGSEWQGRGGGPPADHCTAIALIGLKRYSDAAHRLESLAQSLVKESNEFRAELLSQAAEAWSEGGVPAAAIADLTEAIRLAPADLDYFVNRAAARASSGDYQGAIDDLSKVVAAGAARGDVFAYRAAAYRLSGNLKAAQSDAEEAVRRSPTLAEAWLERANVRRVAGETIGAREDWLQVIRLAPGSAAAEAARHNLEKLDLRPDGAAPSATRPSP